MRTALVAAAVPGMALAQASDPQGRLPWAWAWWIAVVAVVAALVFLFAREPQRRPRR